MKTKVFLSRFVSGIVLFFLFTFSAFSQIRELAKYQVIFTNKAGTPYSLDNPRDYLSERALQRRQKSGISIDSTDLPVNPHYIQGVLNIGGIYLHQSRWFNFITIALSDTSKLEAIRSLPYVKAVNMVYPPGGKKSPNSKRSSRSTQTINDGNPVTNLNTRNFRPDFDFSTTIKAPLRYGFGLQQAKMVGIPYLHYLGYTGKNMVIAVMDAGFINVDSISAFDSLRMNGQILATRDFVEPGADVYIRGPHGLSILSIMAANKPDFLVGLAPHASYLLLRTEDSNSEFRIEELNWIAAAEFADSAGADIIQSSLGYIDFDDPKMDYTYKDMNGRTAWITRGAEMAFSKGMLVVNAIGNEGDEAWKYMGTPADGKNVLSVGAVDRQRKLAKFSSRGPNSEGVLKPDVVALGVEVVAYNPSGDLIYTYGTSVAAPIISGAAACLWQAFPTYSNKQILELIKQSANLYPKQNNNYGYGIPNFTLAYHIAINPHVSIINKPLLMADVDSLQLYVVLNTNQEQKVIIEIYNYMNKKVLQTKAFDAHQGYNHYVLAFDKKIFDMLTSLKLGLYLSKAKPRRTSPIDIEIPGKR